MPLTSIVARAAGFEPQARDGHPATYAEPLPVTVVIPAYNRRELVQRAIASVHAQEAAPAELIVVDDGSTDGTAEVAAEHGARVIRLDANSGAAVARLSGIRAAGQPWIAFLDSDDEWLPWMLSTLWPLRGEHVLLAGASIWFKDGRLERYEGLPVGDAAVLRDPRALVWPQNFVPAAGVLARRDAILETSPDAPVYRYSEDFATWLRLLSHGSALVVARPVVRYHVHAGQKTASPARLVDQHAIVSDLAGGWSWGARRLRRRIAVDAWDESRARAKPSALPQLLRRNLRPGRAVAIGGVLVWRWLQKRRQRHLTPDGDLAPS